MIHQGAKIRWLSFSICSLVLTTGGGCGGDTNQNLSPTSKEDPARYAEAVKINEEAKLKSRETEKRLFKNMEGPPPS